MIGNIYCELHEIGLVGSQVEFSEMWLGRSKRYYSHLIATGQRPGLGTLVVLQLRLRRVLTAAGPLDPAFETLVVLADKLRYEVDVRSVYTAKRRKPYVPLKGTVQP